MSSYWESRERDHIRRQIESDARIVGRLRQNQQGAMRAIENEILSFYSRYATVEGINMSEARKRVSKLDIEELKSKAKRYVAERNLSKRANEEMRIYNVTMNINRLELLKENIRLEMIASTSDTERFFSAELSASARTEYERQSAILGPTVKSSEKNIERIVNASFLNANWSDRLWSNQDALRGELNKLLNDAIVQGLNPRELARRLRQNYDIGIANSERLMRTELARVQGEVFADSMNQGGYSQYIYIAEPDACPTCSALGGEIFEYKNMRVGVNMYPMHPNCRCSTAAHMDRESWEVELRRRGL